jgi:hypothetical protein
VAKKELRGDALTAAELQRPKDELRIVEEWRVEELVRAGYAESAARTIAQRTDVDLHRAVDLLRNGCSPELALNILL